MLAGQVQLVQELDCFPERKCTFSTKMANFMNKIENYWRNVGGDDLHESNAVHEQRDYRSLKQCRTYSMTTLHSQRTAIRNSANLETVCVTTEDFAWTCKLSGLNLSPQQRPTSLIVTNRSERMALENRQLAPSMSPNGKKSTEQNDRNLKMRDSRQQMRPMSMDISRRGAWLKLYRDIELSSVVKDSHSHSQGSLSRSSKSSTHLNIERTSEEPGFPSYAPVKVPKLGSDTLFGRLSKSFSFRFGKGNEKTSKCKAGSTPDLSRSKASRQLENGQTRKSNRSDKCESGDSGIQLDDEINPIVSIRRTKSTSNAEEEKRKTSYPSPSGPTKNVELDALDEFPASNQSNAWLGHSKFRPATVCEDRVDDGFISNDEEDDIFPDERMDCNTIINYRSLPMQYARERRSERKHMEPIRAKVIREMVTTEQSYVKTLNDIIKGYLVPCKKEPELFTSTLIANMFGNIEEVFKFHIKFLDSLMDTIDHENYEFSNIGLVFELWVEQPNLYSDYVCAYPMSMATIKLLAANPIYEKFFEACRRLQLMDKLPLHGFLLRPIQRICQYHLQLSELVKHTDETHEDYTNDVTSLIAMKTVAMRINERQRDFDNLLDIIQLQNSIEGWPGSDLVEKNKRVLRKGELIRTEVGDRPKDAFVILLSHEIIICKKDPFKKNFFRFILRLNLNSTSWLNIDSNEEDDYFGMVHNSWRIFNPVKSTWILITCSSPSEKRLWISSLKQAKPDEESFDTKMIEKAKETSAICAETIQLQINLMAKKSLKNFKLNSDEMLIEVCKLKNSSSVFYV